MAISRDINKEYKFWHTYSSSHVWSSVDKHKAMYNSIRCNLENTRKFDQVETSKIIYKLCHMTFTKRN